MTRVLALADQSKIGCITQRRFAKVGTKTHPQRGADLDRNGLSVSTKPACRFEPKSPVGNSEICTRLLVTRRCLVNGDGPDPWCCTSRGNREGVGRTSRRGSALQALVSCCL